MYTILDNRLTIFLQIDEGFAEDDLETNLQRDKNARLCNMVNQLIDELTPSAPDFQLRDACDQLVSLFSLSTSGSDIPVVFLDQYHDRKSRYARAAGVFTWYVGNLGSTRRKVLQGCPYEASSHHQLSK